MHAICAWMAWSSTSDSFHHNREHGGAPPKCKSGSVLARPAGRTILIVSSRLPPSALEETLDSLPAAGLRADRTVGRTLLSVRRWPGQLADGGSLERRPVAAGIGQSGRADPGLCRAHGAVAQHFRRPHLDRRQGERCQHLQPIRLHGVGRPDPEQRICTRRPLVRRHARNRRGGRRRAGRSADPQDPPRRRDLQVPRLRRLQRLARTEFQHLRAGGAGRRSRASCRPSTHRGRQGLSVQRTLGRHHPFPHRRSTPRCRVTSA